MKTAYLMTIVFALYAFVLATMTSCASTPHKVKELDLEETKHVQGQVGDDTVSINKKSQVIMREEISALDEMRILQNVNMRLQDEYNYEAFQLKQCRKQLASPALGGDGKFPTADQDMFKTPVEIKEELGLVSNDELDTMELKIVKTKLFNQQLAAEKSYKKTLIKMIPVVTEAKEACEWRVNQIKKAAH